MNARVRMLRGTFTIKVPDINAMDLIDQWRHLDHPVLSFSTDDGTAMHIARAYIISIELAPEEAND